jgi:hypothetical protein
MSVRTLNGGRGPAQLRAGERDFRLNHVETLRPNEVSPAQFVRLESNERQRILGENRGTALSSFYSPGLGAVSQRDRVLLDEIRTKYVNGMREQAIEDTETPTNTTRPINRVAMPVPGTAEAISRYEIAIIWKKFDPSKTNMITCGPGGAMDCQPQIIVNPAVWNYRAHIQQQEDAQCDLAAYLRKSPSDYWAGWSFDGIVETEVGLTGRETATTSGFVFASATTAPQLDGCGAKRLTIVRRGPAYVYNVFGHCVVPGSQCYAVLRKERVTPGMRHLSPKQGLGGLNSQVCVSDSAAMDPLSDEILSPLMPYQLSFVAMPPNAVGVPESLHEYYDERGIKRYDAMVIYLGTVFSTPNDQRYRNAGPLLDATPQESVTMMRLLFDCNDGLHGI